MVKIGLINTVEPNPEPVNNKYLLQQFNGQQCDASTAIAKLKPNDIMHIHQKHGILRSPLLRIEHVFVQL